MKVRRWIGWLALAWALVISVQLLFAHRVSGVRVACARGPDGEMHQGASEPVSYSMWEKEGPSAAKPMAVPVLLCLMPPLLRGRGRRAAYAACALLLGGFCAAAGFSVGLFYLPSVTALLLACHLEGAACQAREQEV